MSKKDTYKDVWSIFSKVYKIAGDGPKTELQSELIDKLVEYIDKDRKENVTETKGPGKGK